MERTGRTFTEKIEYVDAKLKEILDAVQKMEKDHAKAVSGVDERYCASAVNLLDYLAFRSFDVDVLQKKMQKLGLSELSDISTHVGRTLLTAKGIADRLLGRECLQDERKYISAKKSRKLLAANCEALFGENPDKRDARIMVTMPSEAADDAEMVESMLSEGMDCARINCAHDDAGVWGKIVENVHECCRKTGKKCSVVMDIAGPKIRTGSLADESIVLKTGDALLLTKADMPGENATYKGCAHISCQSESVFRTAKPDDRVFFDDGKIEGKIEEVAREGIVVRITNAKPSGSKLKAYRGINLPDTHLDCCGFTEKDIEDLKTIAKNQPRWQIRALSLSFVNSARQLDEMIAQLRAIGLDIGIIVKIETEEAFENLPAIMLAAMRVYPAGIMLARGDLAIETGWKNFATIQEEIVRVAAAAHLPVVWATQVLETLAKDGVPTRAEITDAALATKAECVMLNKGRYIVMAIKMLDKIIRRMEKFREKSEDLLPKLPSAANLVLSHKKYDV